MVDGESLKEVQSRNINALYKILKENSNENIVIGAHGTALSTIINYFDKDFSYCAFKEIKNIMPFITYMEFEGYELKKLDYIIKLKSINF
ncbi:histidine phosphatase family protein [Paraclostridium sp. AKS81]|uniref:histidine phosphatase family protein n=1 Tax=Paraclostridium sp. AKS81 TaxID=2876117 RepID=UPI0021DFE9B2|nr:histidine phosphatase family protein [Paraclostridium sp. AKS81]